MPDEVSNKRPEFIDRETEWALMRATGRGETAVKDGTTDYLPMPSGFASLSDGGLSYYQAYQARAQFPSLVGMTLAGMVGVITRKEIKVEMPTSMEGLWESATPDDLPLETLHRTIVAELLLMGRYELLVDGSSEGVDLPIIAGYQAESLINWSDEKDLFVLDESGKVRDGFSWNDQKAFRVLELVDGRYSVRTFVEGAEETLTPNVVGGESLTEIPFVVITATGPKLDVEDPPLIGVARCAVALYQLSADYRWQLFMSGQETLFIFNGDAPPTVGAGVTVSIKADKESGTPDAKYVGPSGVGISSHRQAIIDERDAAVSAGAKLFESSAHSAESGEALKIRYAAQTATLVSVAQAAASGLEKALRHVGRMIGLGDAEVEKIVVTPDLSFIETLMTPEQAVKLMELWNGGGVSYETFYENLRKGGIASTERDAEEERELIDEEDIQTAPDPAEAGFLPPVDPNNPQPPVPPNPQMQNQPIRRAA